MAHLLQWHLEESTGGRVGGAAFALTGELTRHGPSGAESARGSAISWQDVDDEVSRLEGLDVVAVGACALGPLNVPDPKEWTPCTA